MEGRQAYPIRIEGELDPNVGRWLWLVKWLLAIPHLHRAGVSLANALSPARRCVLRHSFYGPLSARDLRLQHRGVLRWTWRVAFYSYAALGTDRYPPFTLEDVPGYPARLEIPYPEQLSRGLVLVKWWLLAIPHYISGGVFLGGGSYAASTGR